MFYTKDKIITYPYKAIIEDVLSRRGPSDKDSFSYYYGKNRLIDEQNLRRGNYEIRELIAGRGDFDVQKLIECQSSILDDIEFEDGKNPLFIENIPEELIEKYIIEVLIGFKKDSAGQKRVMEDDDVFDYIESMDDDEDSEYISPTDVVEVERDAKITDISEAKQKLPFVLKMLWDGSIEKGGLLISFIISRERNHANGFYEDGPTDYSNVWRLHSDGSLHRLFDKDDNKRSDYREIHKWMLGQTPDKYYQAYVDLLRYCTCLDINLAEENPLDYTGEFIEKAVCTYIMSNMEYVNNYGTADKEILNLIKDGKSIFEVAKEVEASDVYDIRVTKQKDDGSIEIDMPALIDTIAMNFETVAGSDSRYTYNIQRNDVSVLRKLFKFIFKDSTEESIDEFMSMLDSKKYLVYDKGTERYLRFNLGSSGNNYGGLISITGHIILVKDTIYGYTVPTLNICTVEEFINATEGNRQILWNVVTL